ncbi:MAG: prepilin-type N-terminal cleavage/methylation domain-containing protein [Patescibacteria group bacterium]
MKKIGGFTLIELLVVIAIIGLISSMSLIVLRGKVMAARDAKRRADMATLQTALELYYMDHQYYPGNNGCSQLPSGHWVCIVDSAAEDGWFVPNLSAYMTPTPPQDPGHHKNPDWNMYGYAPNLFINGRSHAYVIFFNLEGSPQEDLCNIGNFKLTGDMEPTVWSTRCSN